MSFAALVLEVAAWLFWICSASLVLVKKIGS